MFTANQERTLMNLLYLLEDHFELCNSKNTGIITQVIQDLNSIGVN